VYLKDHGAGVVASVHTVVLMELQFMYTNVVFKAHVLFVNGSQTVLSSQLLNVHLAIFPDKSHASSSQTVPWHKQSVTSHLVGLNSIQLISAGVLIKDILDDGKIFTILEKQLEIPKNMKI